MSNSFAPTGAVPPLPEDAVSPPPFEYLTALELAIARMRFAKLKSHHEALGVILEEIHELACEVFKKRERRDAFATLHELVQIATMCQRAAEDLGLLDAKGAELELHLARKQGGAA